MVEVSQLQDIFKIPNDIKYSRGELYQRLHDNYNELLQIGHYLWMKPINYIANLICVLDTLNEQYDAYAIASMYLFVMNIPTFDANNLDKSLKEWCDYLTQDINSYIDKREDFKDSVERALDEDIEIIEKLKISLINKLHFYMITLRYVLAPRIVAASIERPQAQIVEENAHPIYKLYPKADIYGGEIESGIKIGDGTDMINNKSLISSNDIAGLLVKLKSIYMKAAYLQLIQTLSQLAERKSYQTITFRQDELRAVLEQIKRLSSDTFRQLRLEDEIISRICYNIIKNVDPHAEEEKIRESLSLDIGKYPSSAYVVKNYTYT
jgi:hypothetical protein